MTEAIFILGGLFLFALGWLTSVIISKKKVKTANQEAEEIVANAKKDAERDKHKIILEAKEKWYNARDEQEKRWKAQQAKLDEFEKALLHREKEVNRIENAIQQRESAIAVKENRVDEQKEALMTKERELSRLIKKQNITLSRISQISVEEAKTLLLENLTREYKAEAATIYKELLDKAKENANREARKIITMAIERNAADHCVDTSVSVVSLPSEDIKGRIIGRDGRNIKAFETATGIKVIVDDTPEAVVLSGFDPVRREVARLALERMIKNSKINPGKIDELVKQAEAEVEKQIWRAGNEAVAKVGVGRMHPDLIRMLGRLKFRTSYGQNVLQHSVEVATLVGAMAAELKLDVKLAKRAGLLHDIGKAMSQNVEGTHTQIGVEIANKYKEHEVVQNAIASHHEDVPTTSLVSVLVGAADSISGARPGARRDTLDGYIRRIESIEKVADSFDMVAKAYAISAGREVRVMVKPEKVSDSAATLLARDIAQKIQSDLEYPGQIKVTVIRETRAVTYA